MIIARLGAIRSEWGVDLLSRICEPVLCIFRTTPLENSRHQEADKTTSSSSSSSTTQVISEEEKVELAVSAIHYFSIAIPLDPVTLRCLAVSKIGKAMFALLLFIKGEFKLSNLSSNVEDFCFSYLSNCESRAAAFEVLAVLFQREMFICAVKSKSIDCENDETHTGKHLCCSSCVIFL